MKNYVSSSVWRKLAASTINVSVILSFTLLVAFGFKLSFLQAKVVFLITSILYLMLALLTRDHRSIGMVITGLNWHEKYSIPRLLVYGFLYMISVSTLLFRIMYPFDLLLINILLVQLPCVLLTGTTLHGYVSGGITTLRIVQSTETKMHVENKL